MQSTSDELAFMSLILSDELEVAVAAAATSASASAAAAAAAALRRLIFLEKSTTA